MNRSSLASIRRECKPLGVAYIDTIEIHFPCWLTREMRQRIEWHLEPWRACCKPQRKPWWIEPSIGKHGALCGWRLPINRPTEKLLVMLSRVLRDYQPVLTCVHIALDFQPENASALKQEIRQTAVLRWRRPGPMFQWDASDYWVHRKDKPRCTRDLLLYDDRPNRFTGEFDCVHWELRFITARSVRAQSIHCIADLFNINPQALWDKHVAFSGLGAEHVEKICRDIVARDRERHPAFIEKYRDCPTMLAFDEKYRSRLARSVKYTLHIIGMDRAQNVRDLYPKRKPRAIEAPVRIPNKLDWQIQAIDPEGFIENIEESQNRGVTCRLITRSDRQQAQAA